METLPAKTWSPSTSASKKYLSRVLTHRLASVLNSKIYDVVFESPLRKDCIDEPDVVVFNKVGGMNSVMAIEICRTEEINDMVNIVKLIMDKYFLPDFFLFDQDVHKWYNVKRKKSGYEVSTNSFFLGISLDKLSDIS